MTVVHTRKNMLHNLRNVVFRQISLFKNLIKKFSAGANLSYNEEPFFIFKILIYFNDIWVIQTFENIDFIIKGLLLLL